MRRVREKRQAWRETGERLPRRVIRERRGEMCSDDVMGRAATFYRGKEGIGKKEKR